MKLHRNQYCPVHHSRVCCGREEASKARHLTMGVERIDDPNHPRGYRELRSPAELRKVLTQKISTQQGNCGICHEPFTDCKDIVPYADIGIVQSIFRPASRQTKSCMWS